jgi:hypothetical protein
MALNELNTGLKLSTHATAHYMRREVRPLPFGSAYMCLAQRKGERVRIRPVSRLQVHMLACHVLAYK